MNIWRRADCTFSNQNDKKYFIKQIEDRKEFGIFVSNNKLDSKFDVEVWFDWGFESEADYAEFCEAINELIEFCWGEVITPPKSK